MTTLTCKYNLGQVLYFIGGETIPIKHQCPTCLGIGAIKRYDESSIECPLCKGKKEVEGGRTSHYKVYGGTVEKITVYVELGGKMPIVYYHLRHKDEPLRTKDYPEYQLYHDIIDASAECEKLNNKI